MQIIRQKSSNLVMYAGVNLTSTEITNLGVGWCDPRVTSVLAEVISVDYLPQGFLPDCFLYYGGTWVVVAGKEEEVNSRIFLSWATEPSLDANNIVVGSSNMNDGSVMSYLDITWDSVATASAYELRYRTGPTAQWTFLSVLPSGLDTNTCRVTIFDLDKTYEFGLRATCLSGVTAWAVVSKYIPPLVSNVPNVTGLELFGQALDTEFVGKDCRLSWRKVSPRALNEAPAEVGTNPPMDWYWFRQYELIISTGEGLYLRTEFTTAESYNYSYEKNVLDNSGTASRTLKFELRAVATWGDKSLVPATLAVSNPAPAVLSATVESGVVTAEVTIAPARETDLAGYVIYAVPSSELANGTFVPSITNRKYIGSANFVSIPLSLGQWALKVAAYDGFGDTVLNYTPVLMVTVIGKVADMLDTLTNQITTSQLNDALNATLESNTTGIADLVTVYGDTVSAAASAAASASSAAASASSAGEAVTAKAAAIGAASDAVTAKTAAIAAQNSASDSAQTATDKATIASTKASDASGSAIAALNSATSSTSSAGAAGLSATAAHNSELAAGVSDVSAGGYANAAAASATSASGFKDAAGVSATSASSSAVTATASKDAASDSATAAAVSASTASAASTSAGSSAAVATSAKTAAETARDSSGGYATAAATSATSASGFKTAAETASAAATSAKVASESARDAASGSASAAATSASTASTKATEAENSATAANTSKLSAETAAGTANTAAGTATTAKDEAVTAKNAAGTSETNAATSAATATTAKNAANASATAAATSATTATTKATEADTSATSAASSAVTAASGATNADNSATAASGSASSASTSATNAGDSATAASSSATAASTAKTAAELARDNAGDYATAAASSASSASTYKTAAETASTAAIAAKVASESARDAASGSATSASGSANTATTKATEAGNSATAAATSAVTAASGATNAGNSATASATSASSAATYATNAGNSATSASTSATNASTSAGNASTSASSAATSSATAVSSATNASTYASNASGYAATAAEAASTASTAAGTITAQYTIKVDANGKIAGMGLWSDGVTSRVEIVADQFSVVEAGAGKTALVPFIVSGGVTYLAQAAIKSADITTAKIADAAITTAKIGDAQVDTLQIKGNAVIVPVAWWNAASQSVTYSSESTLTGGTRSINVSSACTLVVLFTASANFVAFNTASVGSVYLDLYIDESLESSFLIGSNIATGPTPYVEGYITGLNSISYSKSVSSGTHTVEIRGRTNAFASGEYSSRSLILIGAQR